MIFEFKKKIFLTTHSKLGVYPFTGVEQLHSLEELDVTYNCISNGEDLAPLSFITHLIKLNFEYNLVSNVKDYRLVVLRNVFSSFNRNKGNYNHICVLPFRPITHTTLTLTTQMLSVNYLVSPLLMASAYCTLLPS